MNDGSRTALLGVFFLCLIFAYIFEPKGLLHTFFTGAVTALCVQSTIG